MPTPKEHVLFEFSRGPLEGQFVDADLREAFTISRYRHDNIVMRISRERPWARRHASDVQGAENAWVYFDHKRDPAFVVFGNGPKQPVWKWMFPNDAVATSWAFYSPTNDEYKWRGDENKLQCFRGKKVVASWERTRAKAFPQDRDAVLVLAHDALPVVTEVMATLALHRIRQHLRLATDDILQLPESSRRAEGDCRCVYCTEP